MRIWVTFFAISAMTFLGLTMLSDYFMEREDVPALLAVAKDRWAPLAARYEAIEALRLTGDDRQIAVLIDLLKSNAPVALKYAAIENLAVLGGGNVPDEMRPPSELVFRQYEDEYVYSWASWWEREGKERFTYATAW